MSEVTVELGPDVVRLAIECTSDVEAFAPFELVVEVPRRLVGLIDPRPAAFRPLLDEVARMAGEAVEIDDDARTSIDPVERWIGLVFDAGLDATAALARARADEGGRQITHLVALQSLDEPGRRLSPRTTATEHLASALGVAFVAVATNALGASSPLRPWSIDFASVVQTISRVLPAFSALIVPGTAPTDAMASIGADRPLLEHLVVCSHATAPPNCGRCAACLQALSELAVAGVSVPEGTFSHGLDEDAIEELAASTEATALARATAAVAEGPERLRDAWGAALARSLDDGTGRRLSPRFAVRAAAAAARTGVGLGRGIAFGWFEGDVPIRPEADRVHDLVRVAREPGERVVPWAMLDAIDDGPGGARLAALLTRTWGRGLVWGYGADGWLDEATLARALRAVRVRVWWTDREGLDAGRVLETIEHGCLPLQVMSPAASAVTSTRLPERLRPLVLTVADDVMPLPDDEELGLRMADAIAELSAGCIERDLLEALGTA